ncbi:MAG: hypothetical protein FGM18_00730 [Burkholderiaceae bacterium]|nr:hypothetical protein [Burkholderiaceae bacterium]
MAVTSATSTGINVPEIVTGLMDVERAPVKKLEAQIDQKTLVISTLGVFKSKVAALESAAKAIQTPGVFSLRSANSSDPTKVSATATNAASAGTYSVKVAQTAQAAVLSMAGFTATNQVVDLSTFSMTHAGVEYSPDYAKFAGKTTFASGDKINFTLTGGKEQTFTVTTQTTVDQVVSAINTAVSAGTLSGVIARKNSANELQLSSSNAIQGLTAKITVAAGGAVTSAAVTQEGLSTTTSISSLTELINELDVEVEANLVQIGAGSYSLSLSSTATGAANSLALANLSVATGGAAAQEVQAVSGLTPAQRDIFELVLADGTVLTTAALGATPTIGSLVAALQADLDYSTSNVVITEGAGADLGKLILTYKSNADVGVATLKKTASEPAVTSVDGSSGSQEVQTISSLTLDSAKNYTLTLADNSTLTAANPVDIDDLLAKLIANGNYAASDVVLSKSGSDLVITYKSVGNKSAAALHQDRVSVGALGGIDGDAESHEVQTLSGLTLNNAKNYTLTLADNTTLTAENPTDIDDLLFKLTANDGYAASDIELSKSGSDLVITYKSFGNKSAAALYEDPVSVGVLGEVNGFAASQEVQKTATLAPAIGDVYSLTLPNGKVLTTAALTAATIADLVSKLTADLDYSTDDMTLSAGSGADEGKLVLTYTANGDVGAATLVRTAAVGTLTTTTAGSSGAATYSALSASTLQSARDAFFSVNGLAVQRASNQVDDVVNGVTFSLDSPVLPAGGALASMADQNVATSLAAASATIINVTKGAEDLSGAAVEDFVTAYNDLVGFYKTESMSSQDPEARGVLNGDSTLRTFMDRIRGLYANGIRLADGSNITFTSIGVEVQRDGTLFLDKGDLNTAIANGLQDKFAQGVTLGYASSSLSLTSFLTSSLRSSGIVSAHISDVETQQTRLEERVSDWEDKLARIEQRYYRQYAALDALLFRLQTTSNALTSAIESLVNSQKSG